MPSERELDHAAADLQRFRLEHEHYAASQNELLQQYQTLIRDYRRLQADYDEARDSRDNYKRLSRGSDRDPFVLVLIDGDGYVFSDDFVGSGIEGGARAAQQLETAVKRSLKVKGLQACRIVVRVYANLSGLSKAGAKEKLCGAEKRALAPFVASFNGANALFDFVDVGEQKDAVNLKLRAHFLHFIDNAQCRHIFFAACHDTGYINDITPHADKQDRITLLRNHAFQEDFDRLGLPDEQLLPNVFRRSPLADPALAKPAKACASVIPQAEDLISLSDDAPVCSHFQQGRCAYGSRCRKRHLRAPIDDIKDWRQKPRTPIDQSRDSDWDQGSVGARPDSRRSMAQEFDAKFRNGVHNRHHDSHGSDGDALQQTELTKIQDLPRPEDIPRERIAVNADGHRLDPYMDTTPRQWATFTAWTRDRERKLCNNFHLTNDCPHPTSCQYDHSPIDESLRDCLRQAAWTIPCKSKNGSCRDLACNYGHVCQRSECRFRGGKWPCRFKPEAHTIDFHASDFVDGVRQENGNTSYSTRSHSTAPDAGSEHESQHANRWAETNTETEVLDDIDAVLDTVGAGHTEEDTTWGAQKDTWATESEPQPEPVPQRKSKRVPQPEPEPDNVPTWDGRW